MNRKRAPRRKTNPARLVGGLLLTLGLIALAFAIIYESTILAFIGLSLTFWGPLLLFASTEKYVKQTLLDSAVTASLENLNQILTELKYQGKATYLPPKYLKDFETSKVYIRKDQNTNLPTPEEIQQKEDKIFLENPEAALISPPGLSLSKLFEKTLGITFTKVDLQYLQQNLPKLFVEDLEIAENLEIQAENGIIHVKLANPILRDPWKENRKLLHLCGSVGCPICSAIACALTKATGKPVTIEGFQPSEDDRVIEATYRVLEITEPQVQIEKVPTRAAEVIELRPSRLSQVAVFFLITLGLIILVWVGWFTWYEITAANKDFIHIFFGSRIGEIISLGMGMRVIYYFLISLALLFSGLIIFVLRRQGRM